MARISLKQIVGAQNGLRPVVAALELAFGDSVAVEDAAGACTANESAMRLANASIEDDIADG